MAGGRNSRLASPRDLAAVSYLFSTWLALGLLPRGAVTPLARILGRTQALLARSQTRTAITAIDDRLGPLENEQMAARIWRVHLESRHEHVLGRVLELHRRRWRPRVEIRGLEHLDAARRRGKGTILWVMSFCGPLVFKIGLAQSGVVLTHLSTRWHGGFSRSWVSLELLNRWAVRAEAPYLEDRIVVSLDRSREYFGRIEDCLARNGVLSIQGEHRGRRHNARVSILGERVEIATGAPFLAASHDAALLTVTTSRKGAFEYRVTLQPPIALPPGSGSVEIDAACQEFARRLEDAIRASPSDWERWSVGGLEV